ncbi:MAG: hypothetical protein AB7G13_32595 [Lautropia sp.]
MLAAAASQFAAPPATAREPAEPPAATKEPAQRYGTWRVKLDPSSVYVWARNDAGAQFGLYCSRGLDTCVHYLVAEGPCDSEARIPAMLNASTGTLAVTLQCLPIGSVRALVLSDFDGVHQAIRSGGVFGIVYPLRSGRFQVSRFNADQFATALSSAKQTQPTIEHAPAKTRDTWL